MYIDAHVHLRDFKQRHKETVKHGLEVARDSGLDAVFAMPNTDPPIIDEQSLEDYFTLIDNSGIPEVFCGIYLGLTADPKQVKRAVDLHRKHFPRVVGFKLYAGESVGNLAVIDPTQQITIYETLTKEGFRGVLAVHAEKEMYMNKKIFRPEYPISHCFARPERAEQESIRDQVSFTKASKFKGKLHIPHISTELGVKEVIESKKQGVDISCSVCPHHLFFNHYMMTCESGILYKMNPPLRPNLDRMRLIEFLKVGEIDWLETDHAPHTYDEKTKPPFMSGIPGLPWWPLFVEGLKTDGFSDQRIQEITFDNIIRRFGIDINQSRRPIKDHRSDYAFNPYKSLEFIVQKP